MDYKHIFFVMCCFVNVLRAFEPVHSKMSQAAIVDAQKSQVEGPAASSTDTSAQNQELLPSKAVAILMYYTPCGGAPVYSLNDPNDQTIHVPSSPVRWP